MADSGVEAVQDSAAAQDFGHQVDSPTPCAPTLWLEKDGGEGFRKKGQQAMGGRVPHVELGGPLFYKEIAMGLALGLAAAYAWKAKHREMQKRTKAFYQHLDSGHISVAAEDC
ncbi:hypothetical protein DM860_016825 [Cuscuta australis]|uniref:Cytochrome c oxidase subunit 5C n=1 Tax=Cuscuta australis TaxID=267555 RepID=A0A328E0B5_9ASTE|nr:hypothetical protein DM860_016825 [Cuscuta australis]